MREQLIKAAKDLATGIEPPALENYAWNSIRGGERILSQGEDWRVLGTDREMPLEQWLAAGV
jgi:hypothetical protein